MRLVLDTNILLDACLAREPYDRLADMLMALGYLGEFELWVGSSQITDLVYVMTDGGKPSLAEAAKRQMALLRRSIHIYGTSEGDYDAVSRSTWDDLEDAFVFQTALAVKADAIVTRDRRGFGKSSIRALDYDELFASLETEASLAYDIVDL